MKTFYTFTLLLGFVFAIMLQFVCVRLPKDAFVAIKLAQSPDSWNITVDDKLHADLSRYSVKEETLTALTKRIEFHHRESEPYFWLGLALIVMSVIGFIREIRIGKERRVAAP